MLIDASNTYVDGGYDEGTQYYNATTIAPTATTESSTGLVYAYYDPTTQAYGTDPCAGCQPAVWDPQSQEYYVLPSTSDNPAAPPPPEDPYTFYNTATSAYAREACDTCVPVVYDSTEGKYFTTGEAQEAQAQSAPDSSADDAAVPAPSAEDAPFSFYNVATEQYTNDNCGADCIPVEIDETSGEYVTKPSTTDGLEDDEDSTTLVDDYTFLLSFANLTNFGNDTTYTIFAPTNAAIVEAINATYAPMMAERNITGEELLEELRNDNARMTRLRRVLLHTIAPSVVRLQGLASPTDVAVLCGPSVLAEPAPNATSYAAVGGAAVLLADVPVATGLMSIVDAPPNWPYDPTEVDAWTCTAAAAALYPGLL